MRWARRVKLWKIRRLYSLVKLGIYDDELLLEVGWGLYARCQSVLKVTRAVRGEVPCPQCEQIVYRSKYYRRTKRRSSFSSFFCPICNQNLTWQDCRDVLRRYPKCFVCQRSLEWDYAENRLTCSHCEKEWTWKQYRKSVSRRKILSCPHCGNMIRRPEKNGKKTHVPSEFVECPICQGASRHANAKLQCLQCGYEEKWKSYRRRIKRRVERLQCDSCGYEFTWQSWRKQYQGQHLLVGNPHALEDFLSKWIRCKTNQEKIIQIDILIHALHARGAMAPALLEGNKTAVMELLDGLAEQH